MPKHELALLVSGLSSTVMGIGCVGAGLFALLRSGALNLGYIILVLVGGVLLAMPQFGNVVFNLWGIELRLSEIQRELQQTHAQLRSANDMLVAVAKAPTGGAQKAALAKANLELAAEITSLQEAIKKLPETERAPIEARVKRLNSIYSEYDNVLSAAGIEQPKGVPSPAPGNFERTPVPAPSPLTPDDLKLTPAPELRSPEIERAK
jgi:hypothetical protein